MHVTRLALVALVALALAAPAARAQDTPRTPDAATRAAAEELLTVMKTEATIAKSIDQMLDLQVKQNPALVPARDAMKQFFAKHLAWAAVKDDLIAMHAGEFTEAELKELTAFFKTPVGQKLAEKQGMLANKGAEIGMRKVQENQAELIKMVEEAHKKGKN